MAIAEELRLEVTAQVETAVRDLQRINKTTGEIIKKGEILKRTGEQLTRFGRNWSLFVTAPILAAGAAMIKTASDAEEITSKYDAVFNRIGQNANDMAKEIADSFDLSIIKSKEMMGATADMLTGFGFTQEAALDLSAQVTSLGVDLASFTNYQGGAEGAATALTKALLGEREMVKSLGIAILEEDVKAKVLELRKQGLTFETERQAKAYATLMIAQEQSKNAIGDYERTSSSLANQLRAFKQDVIDLAVAFGKELIPQAKEIIAKVRSAVQWFTDLDKGTKELIITVASIAAVIGPLILTIGTLTKAIYGITVAMQAFNLTNPVGWIILAASAAATLAYVIVKHWDKIVKWTKKIYEAIKKFLVEQFILMMQDVGKIAAGFVNTWNWVKSKFTKEEFIPIENAFQGFTDKLITVRQEMDNIGDSAKETAAALADIDKDIKNLNKTTEDTTKAMGISEETLKKLYDAYSQLPEGQIEALEANIEFWEGQLENAGTYGPIVIKVIDALRAQLQELKKEFEGLTQTSERFADTTLSNFGIIADGFLNVSDASKDFIANLLDSRETIITTTSALIDMHRYAEEFANIDYKNIESNLDILKDKYKELGNEILNTFNSVTDSLITIWGNYYDKQMEGMDEESNKYKELTRKRAVAEKAMALLQATVNTAAAITKALASAPPPINFILAALSGAAGAMQIAAIASTPLPTLAEGGIVTKPTLAMIGERGPEAVVPLGRGGAAPTIVVNVSGSVLTEEGIARRIGSIWRRQNRGY